MFEMMIIDPVTYKPFNFNIFKHVSNVEVTKAFNEIGSFTFSVKADFADFENAITTANGQGQVMIYANGKPYVHGVIDTYTPNDNGFIDVDCTEILQLLKDDVILGDLLLTNYESEYVPNSSPSADDVNEQQGYWGQIGESYFYSPVFNNSDGKQYLYAQEDEGGAGRYPDAPDMFHVPVRLYPRWLLNNHVMNYNLILKSYGTLTRFYFVSGFNFNARTTADINAVDDGIFLDVTLKNAGTWNLMEYFTGDYNINLKVKVGETITTVSTVTLTTQTRENGNAWRPFAMTNSAEIETEINFSEDGANYYVSFTMTFESAGDKYTVQLGQTAISKSLYTGGNTAQAWFIPKISSQVRTFKFPKAVRQPIQTWLHMTSGPIDFIDASGVLAGFAWKLKFNDVDRWQVVKRLLELAGPATIHYVGIQNGKPTYQVYDYEALATVYKFATGSEMFNVSYLKDFSDTYNVLTARASSERKVQGKTVKTNYEVTIAPNPDRPNRLGRLKRKVLSPSGITDSETLTQWALTVYEEHSYPEEPIDFDTFISDFWLDVKMGQYLTIHGLLQGKTLTEQVNKVSLSFSSGMISVELAKRVTLKSALMEARLQDE